MEFLVEVERLVMSDLSLNRGRRSGQGGDLLPLSRWTCSSDDEPGGRAQRWTRGFSGWSGAVLIGQGGCSASSHGAVPGTASDGELCAVTGRRYVTRLPS